MFIQFCKQITLEIVKGNLKVLKNFRYYKEWKDSQSSSSMLDSSPCITYEARNILDKYLTKNMIVFEYGGGGSSLYFSNKSKQVFSVEHNQNWYNKISQTLENKNWKGFFVPPIFQSNDLDPSNPEHYTTWEKDAVYHDYVKVIDQFSDNYFDLIMIDGRSRPSCIKHSIQKLKKGGLLIVDDIYRDYYLKNFKDKFNKEFIRLCWRKGPVPYYDFFAQTGIWQKK